jgi:hypothetical protein
MSHKPTQALRNAPETPSTIPQGSVVRSQMHCGHFLNVLVTDPKNRRLQAFLRRAPGLACPRCWCGGRKLNG